MRLFIMTLFLILSAAVLADTRIEMVRGGGICVAKAKTVDCFNGLNPGQLKFPITFKKEVTSISYSGSSLCVSDSTDVHCFGEVKNPPIQLRDVTKVSVGYGNACAIRSDRKIICWGDKRIQYPSDFEDVEHLANDLYGRYCAINSSDHVKCWGGKLANYPRKISGVKNLKSGEMKFCALTSTSPVCWGSFSKEELGRIQNFRKVSDIAMSGNNICVVDSGELECFGKDVLVLDHPRKLDKPGSLAMSYVNACVLENGKKIVCWGDDSTNPMLRSKPLKKDVKTMSMYGVSTMAIDSEGVKTFGAGRNVPSWVNTIRNPKLLSSGTFHNCVANNNEVKCWRYDGTQLKTPRYSNDIIDLSSGSEHTCVIDSDGLNCWGHLRFGGDGIPAVKLQPTSLVKPSKLSSGYAFSCVIDDGEVICWGHDPDGKYTKVPSNVREAIDISSGRSHTCAVMKRDIVCWGYNGSGQLDVDSNAKINVRKIVSGFNFSCSLGKFGVICWGGRDSTIRNVPKFKGKVIDVWAGSRHACAKDEYETLKCWGDNSHHQTTLPLKI